jgi:uncharacterized protein YggE
VAGGTTPITTAIHTISIDATGVAHGTPDIVELALAVEVQAPTTQEVLATASDRSAALRDYLLGQGIADSDLRTTSLSVYPNYGAYSESGSASITGYTATVSMTVGSADLTKASGLVDGAAGIVGDSLRINGLTWSMSNTDALTAEARTDAIAAARVQAGQLATASGLTLGDIVSVSESANSGYPYFYMGGEGDSSAIPLDPGTGTVSVSVNVVFAAS